ncbi:MAG: TonB-dependent siderophore receptor [Comamonas sp.]|uniref:TonB-dependent siderophore receptor n=1 Tax=Comamonas sp. TaxID=34028 RepID=UPI003D0C4124
MSSFTFKQRHTALAHAAVCLGLALHLQASMAQTASFDIPAQPLASALAQLARQANLSFSAAPDAAQGRQAPALQGVQDVSQALNMLLQGSGLQGRVEGGVLTVQATAPAQAAAAVAAPSAAPATGSEVTLSEVTVRTNQLGEITEGSGSYTPGAIATATRLVLTPRETPQSVSVVTRQVMDDFQLHSIDDVINHTPGVSIVTYDSERTEYYARGFAIQNFQYDGIPMSRNSAYSAGNTLTDMSIYDRVEVLKGATGLLTGSGDPGATINLVRKKPTKEFSGHATISAGSYQNYRGELDISGALNDSGSIRARGVASYQDKHSQLDRYERKTGVLYGIVEMDLTPQTLLTVGADRQDNKPTASTWGGIPLLDAKGNFNAMPRLFNNGAGWSHWDQYTRTAFATLEHNFDSGWVTKLQLNHQINGYNANLGAAAGGNPDPVTGTGVSLWRGQYIGRTTSDAADLYASGPFSLLGRQHELVVGGSLAKSRWKNDGYYNDNSGFDGSVSNYYQWNGKVPAPIWNSKPDYTDDETTHESGIYTAARWNLRDDLKLITGGRFSNYKNRVQEQDEKNVFAPYLGAVYDLNQNYSVYASYSGIFKPQSYQTEQGRTLDPLEGKNYELGAKASFLGGRLNASAAIFQTLQDNFAVESGGITPSGNPAYRAIQGVKTRGWEAEVSGQITPAWQIQAGYSHSIARKDGERVSTLTPSNQFNLYTSYKMAGSLSGLTVGGGARWQDKTWGTISVPTGGNAVHTVPNYWVWDAMARYDFNKQLSASLSVKNLFDKKYYTIFSWYSTYTWGEPRTVNVSLNYKF